MSVFHPRGNASVDSVSHSWPVFHPAKWKTPAVLTGVLTVANVFHNTGKSTGVLY